ncbi:hypothetical protein ACNKHO_26750 [Shigella flexneri]
MPVKEVFVRLYKEISFTVASAWSTDRKLRTAISDLEVENRDERSTWHIRYPLATARKPLTVKITLWSRPPVRKPSSASTGVPSTQRSTLQKFDRQIGHSAAGELPYPIRWR